MVEETPLQNVRAQQDVHVTRNLQLHQALVLLLPEALALVETIDQSLYRSGKFSTLNLTPLPPHTL